MAHDKPEASDEILTEGTLLSDDTGVLLEEGQGGDDKKVVVQTPGPGIYPGVPFQDYIEWQCMNGSLLNSFVLEDGTVSPKHFYGYMIGRLEKKSKALRFGRAMHLRLLEPERYKETMLFAMGCAAVLKSGARKGSACGNSGILYHEGADKWFCKTKSHAPGSAVEPYDYVSVKEGENLEEMVKSIGDHQTIQLLKMQGQTESSFVWDQEVEYQVAACGDCEKVYWPPDPGKDFARCSCGGQTKLEERSKNVLMKGRVDKDMPSPSGIPPSFADIKKVAFGRHTDFFFGKQVDYLNYDSKIALYRDGLLQLDEIKRVPIWIVIEESYPYDCNPIRADKETIAIGRNKYKELLRLFCIGQDTGVWPGIASDIHTGGLNAWAKRKHEGKV